MRMVHVLTSVVVCLLHVCLVRFDDIEIWNDDPTKCLHPSEFWCGPHINKTTQTSIVYHASCKWNCYSSVFWSFSTFSIFVHSPNVHTALNWAIVICGDRWPRKQTRLWPIIIIIIIVSCKADSILFCMCYLQFMNECFIQWIIECLFIDRGPSVNWRWRTERSMKECLRHMAQR